MAISFPFQKIQDIVKTKAQIKDLSFLIKIHALWSIHTITVMKRFFPLPCLQWSNDVCLKKLSALFTIFLDISPSKYMQSTINPFFVKIQSHSNSCDTLLTGLVYEFTKENQSLPKHSLSHLKLHDKDHPYMPFRIFVLMYN